jgi:hypothetical protein
VWPAVDRAGPGPVEAPRAVGRIALSRSAALARA